MSKTYSITREAASKSLNISTRTIDRYIKSGKLSYKKIANKVLLAREELDELQKEFSMLHQEINSELVGGNYNNESNGTSINVRSQVESVVDEKMDKFVLIFKEKDKIVEEKNKIIFVLQQRVNELEGKIQNMVALPDYTKEKQELLIEKEKLEMKIDQLRGNIKNEKVKNLIFITLILIAIVVIAFFFALNK